MNPHSQSSDTKESLRGMQNYLNTQMDNFVQSPEKYGYISRSKGEVIRLLHGKENEDSTLELIIPSHDVTLDSVGTDEFYFHIYRDKRLSPDYTCTNQCRSYEIVIMNQQLVTFLLNGNDSRYYHHYGVRESNGGVRIDPASNPSAEKGLEIKNIIDRTHDWVFQFEARLWLRNNTVRG